jgi:hypothetical protein
VELVLSLPTVKVAKVDPLFVTLPLPESEPMLLLNPWRSSNEVTLNAEVALNAVGEPACSVPELTLVVPL